MWQTSCRRLSLRGRGEPTCRDAKSQNPRPTTETRVRRTGRRRVDLYAAENAHRRILAHRETAEQGIARMRRGEIAFSKNDKVPNHSFNGDAHFFDKVCQEVCHAYVRTQAGREGPFRNDMYRNGAFLEHLRYASRDKQGYTG